MPDPDAVAAALARLVTGGAPAEPSPPPNKANDTRSPDRVVAGAEAALEDLPSAAAFVDSGGEQRLRRAIDESDQDPLEARGRTVLDALERLRTAAGVEERTDETETRSTDADHFHRGHTTLLKGAGVASER